MIEWLTQLMFKKRCTGVKELRMGRGHLAGEIQSSHSGKGYVIVGVQGGGRSGTVAVPPHLD